jgi:hypothetical protein
MSAAISHFIHPIAGKPGRVMDISRGTYGVMVHEPRSLVSVAMDWNGDELKIVVTDSQSDDLHTVIAFKEDGTVKSMSSGRVG